MLKARDLKNLERVLDQVQHLPRHIHVQIVVALVVRKGYEVPIDMQRVPREIHIKI